MSRIEAGTILYYVNDDIYQDVETPRLYQVTVKQGGERRILIQGQGPGYRKEWAIDPTTGELRPNSLFFTPEGAYRHYIRVVEGKLRNAMAAQVRLAHMLGMAKEQAAVASSEVNDSSITTTTTTTTTP